ncbi:sarcosine oxidase subunit alpha [Sphingobium sp. OAS761]|uniref:sarcosine oxidase subunit alpha family protein n=1 Tax=Sphingobium sp. OAS761 TaxID=2817901 RepID=UPI00209CE7D3|nr:sarcosine oxidase subunit alpha [Sphingobium sp. OAS761]
MTGQPFRSATGGRIDRSRTLRFRFGGRDYVGHPGDTLASALLANGVRLLGRSFKYHRPRGLLAAGVEEPNALVQLGEGARVTPNVRATEVPLYEGLVASSVNCWPSARFDIGAVNDLLHRFLAAGFYYKTFMWPNWHLYEGFVRRAAGLGRPSREADPDRYVTRNAHCDLLVVGAGPAGLAAARAAAERGERIILVEQDMAIGGSLLHDNNIIDGLDQDAWIAGVRAALDEAPDARILTRTTAVGYFDHNALALVEALGSEVDCAATPDRPRFRLWQVRAARVVLATGAIERPLVFAGNDRPGVMLAGAARTYAARFGVLPGKRALVVTNDDEAYRVAEALIAAGMEVAELIDLRATVPADLAARLAAHGVAMTRNATVDATRGRGHIRAARIRLPGGATRWVRCDCLAMSGGFSPAVHLFSQSGGTLRFDEQRAAFVPERSVQPEVSVGGAAGDFDLTSALASGYRAGGGTGAAPSASQSRQPSPPGPLGQVAGDPSRAFVDYQNDVTAADVALAARESFRSVEHLKRYTTLGMAPDQGKTSNVNGLALLAGATARTIAETGTTRFRFPYTPLPLSVMAGWRRGDLFRPVRFMPGHGRHVTAGALFEDFGGWQRPACYPRAGEDRHAAEQREALAVRQGAGLFEGSPLGKIEIVGPDAARFLDRIYANTMSTLQPGKVRYGLMLSEIGAIIDDGVCARLAEDRFLVCTSSGGAARISAWLEEWHQCEWPDLDLVIAPVTSAWGVLTLSGPAARAILSAVGTDINLAADAFPHMSWRQGLVGGMAARILRVSYTGDLSYEINVPASRVPELWDRLMAAGAGHGIAPVGIDAWMLLRTEKGYLHIGADTDGTTTPLDVGWPQVLRKKSDFIGKRSLFLPENLSEDRLAFVGFASDDPAIALPIGAHVLGPDGSDGYVTSSGFSPTLGHGVALGLIRGGAARVGERVVVRGLDGDLPARVTSPVHFDAQGERLNG